MSYLYFLPQFQIFHKHPCRRRLIRWLQTTGLPARPYHQPPKMLARRLQTCSVPAARRHVWIFCQPPKSLVRWFQIRFLRATGLPVWMIRQPRNSAKTFSQRRRHRYWRLQDRLTILCKTPSPVQVMTWWVHFFDLFSWPRGKKLAACCFQTCRCQNLYHQLMMS